MGFWDWFSRGPERPEGRFGSAKSVTVIVTVFVLVPLLLYYLIKWDPVIGVSEDGEPATLGFWLVIGLYWACAYFSYKGYGLKKRLNRLLDMLLDDEEADHLFKTAKSQRKTLKEDRFSSEEGESRGRWFGV